MIKSTNNSNKDIKDIDIKNLILILRFVINSNSRGEGVK